MFSFEQENSKTTTAAAAAVRGDLSKSAFDSFKISHDFNKLAFI